jgi:predicted DNA-binding transcriptional regulator AlpA
METETTPLAEPATTTRRSRDQIPFEERWLSVGEIGELIGLGESQTLRTIVCRPDFPAPLRIGKPRWPAKEVKEWLHSRRCEHPTAANGGRPRNVRARANVTAR